VKDPVHRASRKGRALTTARLLVVSNAGVPKQDDVLCGVDCVPKMDASPFLPEPL